MPVPYKNRKIMVGLLLASLAGGIIMFFWLKAPLMMPANSLEKDLLNDGIHPTEWSAPCTQEATCQKLLLAFKSQTNKLELIQSEIRQMEENIKGAEQLKRVPIIRQKIMMLHQRLELTQNQVTTIKDNYRKASCFACQIPDQPKK